MGDLDPEILKKLQEKYEDLNQDPNIHLDGLYHARPITYWDYIQTDSLLSLQTRRTNLPDEMVFIMYHQINELLFKMIRWEIDQVATKEAVQPDFFSMKLERVSRYFDMLSESFNIMGDGMEVSQYMKFRNTLAPASGFQSAQYRTIEFMSTHLINLIDYRFRATIDRDTPFKHAFEHLYWMAAGKNHKTGEKAPMIKLFETKYREEIIRTMRKYNKTNMWTKFNELPDEHKQNLALVNSMRHYDHTVNVSWVMAHYNAASKYLESGEGSAEATGGSEWQKYMHPRYQRRIFFPELWSQEELDNWGVDNLEGHKVLEHTNSISNG